MAAHDTASRPNLYQTVTDAIIQQLERGVAPWIQPWTAGGLDAALPYNAVTSRPYNGSNVVLLWISAAARRFSSHGWLTYRQAQQCGAQVKKGEKGTLVTFARMTPRATGDDNDAETTRFFPVLKAFHVFNVCQVADLPAEYREGTSARRPPSSDGDAIDKRATAFLSRIGADVRHGGSQAFYSPVGDYIQLPSPGAFHSRQQHLAMSLHEHVHWSGHQSRLARTFGQKFGDHAYACEELCAELGSAFLCARLGVKGELQHASYIKSWLAALKADRKLFFAAASKATQAADFLAARGEPDASLVTAA